MIYRISRIWVGGGKGFQGFGWKAGEDFKDFKDLGRKERRISRILTKGAEGLIVRFTKGMKSCDLAGV